MADLSKAVDGLADMVPNGHLLAATRDGGAALLTAAAEELRALRARVADADAVRHSLNEMVRVLDGAVNEVDADFDAGAIERVLGTAAWNDQLTVVKADTVRYWMAKIEGLRRVIRSQAGELRTARAAVGEAWFAGGATLAEAIDRKYRMLEGLNTTKIPDELARWLEEDHDRVLSIGVDGGEGVQDEPGWYADASKAGGAREDTGYGDTLAEALEDLWKQVSRG